MRCQMYVPFGTSSPLTLCRPKKNRAMGHFVTVAQMKRAQLEQWRFFADKSQAELLGLGMTKAEAARFMAHALKASKRLAAELGLNHARVEGKDHLATYER